MSVPRKNRRKRWLFLLLAALLAAVLWAWHPWQRPITIVESVNPQDGAAMVWVPAGKFRMGTSLGDDLRAAARRRDWREVRDVAWSGLRGKSNSDESPSHTVYLDGYWIYKYEVTVAQYREFCRATKRKMPPMPRWGWRDNDPITNVAWNDATAYAAWAGASLPTEAQWEKAARGPDGRLYPWGNAWDRTKCRNSPGLGPVVSPSPVGSYPADTSPYGAQDMAGNVLEWCADWYDENYYRHAPYRNPAGPKKGISRVLRGGCWYGGSPDYYFRCAARPRNNPISWGGNSGFRCVVASPGP